jgi:hypothetical protein
MAHRILVVQASQIESSARDVGVPNSFLLGSWISGDLSQVLAGEFRA